jgi:hypothetical protein
MSPRLSFALALFHAFGHQMACQVVYSPRWKQGFGLTNGEGNERVWALSTDTIGAERVMGVSRYFDYARVLGYEVHLATPPEIAFVEEDGEHRMPETQAL